MKRREFLNNTAKTIALGSVIPGYSFSAINKGSALGSLLASSAAVNDHVLVIIQLNGGNDGLNTLIPIDQYANLTPLRGGILIPETDVLKFDKISGTGLHPAMTGVHNLYKEGKAGFVQGVGYPQQNFSHFRSTDIWLTGSDSNTVEPTGWMGRYLDHTFPNFPNDYPTADMPDPLAIQIGSLISPGFQGPTIPMAVAISSDKDFYNLVNGSHSTPSSNAIGKELKYIREVTDQAKIYNTAIKNAALKVTTQGDYPDKNTLAAQLKIVAKLIKGGLKTKIYMVSQGGYDTHAAQVDPMDNKVGSHAKLLGTLSDAIYAFQNDLKGLGIEDKVIGMTFSEFGRRIVANGSDGTDHGSSLPMIFFGTNISNGIVGVNPEIKSTFTGNDNLPMQYDFRSVYASILEKWFCLDKMELNTLLKKDYQTLPIIKKSACNPDTTVSIDDYQKTLELNRLKCYPNPFTDKVNIEIESLGGHCLVQIFDTEGRVLSEVNNTDLQKGHHSLSWKDETLPTGFYYCRFQNESYQTVFTLQKVK